MVSNHKIPRGVWYEADRDRWRVRRYRNNKAYLAGYFATKHEAVLALASLDAKLERIPKIRCARRDNKKKDV